MTDVQRLEPRPIREEDIPELAGNAARFQANPATGSSYLGLGADTVLAEINDMAPPLLGTLIGDASDPIAWILGEIDTEIGRVWWMGPFATAEEHADAVYRTALGLLPASIVEEELAGDQSNTFYRDFAGRHGFQSDPASYALTRPILPAPGSLSSSVVRPMTPSDHLAVRRLHDEVFAAAHYTGEALTNRSDAAIFVVDIDEDVVGYIVAEHQPDNSIYIDFLGVAVAQRRAGVGSDLVVEVCRWAAQEGGSHIHLTVRETLLGARALYESLGFTVESVLVPYRKGFSFVSPDDRP